MDADHRPYAPPTAVIRVLDRLRKRNLPDEITLDVLERYCASRSIAGRVRQALEFLGLLDDGLPTATLEALVRNSGASFTSRLAEQVRKTYADIFAEADPFDHSGEEVLEAFRRFAPRSQHYRMALLFLELCRHTEIPTTAQLVLPLSPDAAETPSGRRANSAPPNALLVVAPGLEHDLIWDLVKDLPAKGRPFAKRRLERWLRLMRDAVHHVYDETSS